MEFSVNVCTIIIYLWFKWYNQLLASMVQHGIMCQHYNNSNNVRTLSALVFFKTLVTCLAPSISVSYAAKEAHVPYDIQALHGVPVL